METAKTNPEQGIEVNPNALSFLTGGAVATVVKQSKSL